MKDWKYAASDYLRLMIDFLEGRLTSEKYGGRLFDMMKERCFLSDEADVVIQRAYGDANDFDQSISLPFTINESELRERVTNSVKKLQTLQGQQPDEIRRRMTP